MRKRLSVFIAIIFCFLCLSGMSEEIIDINNSSIYSVSDLEAKAAKAIKQKKYKQAAFYYEKIISKNPRNEKARLNLALALFESGERDKAVRQYVYLINNSSDKSVKSYAESALRSISSPVAEKPADKHVKTELQVVDFTKPDGNNYICSCIDNTGSFRRWEKEEMPLKVYIPLPPSQYFIFPGAIEKKLPSRNEYAETVKRSMKKWAAKIPDLQLDFYGNEQNANIIINWHEYFRSVSYWGHTSAPAYFDDIAKKVSYINLPVKTQPGTATFSYEPVFFNLDELGKIIFHEFGHSLGLGHSENNEDIMSPEFISSYKFSHDFDYELSARDLETYYQLNSLPEKAKVKCNNEQDLLAVVKPKSYKNKYTDLRKDKTDHFLCFLPGTLPEVHSDGKSFIRNYSRWEKDRFPLKVYLPQPSAKEYQIDNPEHFRELVKAGMLQWMSRAPDIIRFNFIDNEESADIVVKWADYFAHESYWGAAQTITDPGNRHSKIKVNILLAVRAQPGWYSDVPLFFGDELFTKIVIHETGHALGLDHGPDVNGATGRGSVITDRDINTLRRLYSIPTDHEALCQL